MRARVHVCICMHIRACVCVCVRCAWNRCNVLQCVPASCSVLKSVAVCGRVGKLTAQFFPGSPSFAVAVCCSVLQRISTCCSVLQCDKANFLPKYLFKINHNHRARIFLLSLDVCVCVIVCLCVCVWQSAVWEKGGDIQDKVVWCRRSGAYPTATQVYVCACLTCIYVCMNACIYVCIYLNMFVCMYMNVCICVYICVCLTYICLYEGM